MKVSWKTGGEEAELAGWKDFACQTGGVSKRQTEYPGLSRAVKQIFPLLPKIEQQFRSLDVEDVLDNKHQTGPKRSSLQKKILVNCPSLLGETHLNKSVK